MAMSPADRQVEANEDVERIARAYYETANDIYADLHGEQFGDWDEMAAHERALYRECTRRLLHGDVIRVGRRPSGERPMEGQVTIDEQLDP